MIRLKRIHYKGSWIVLTEPRSIYIITCDKTQKRYVGSTHDIDERYMQHIYCLRGNRHINAGMQKDFNDYGEGSFHIESFGKYPAEVGYHLEYLLMVLLDTRNPEHGYNYNDRRAISSEGIFRSEVEMLKAESKKQCIPIKELLKEVTLCD